MGLNERIEKLERISGTTERKYAELPQKKYDKVLIAEKNNPGKHKAIWRAFDLVESETGLYDCTGELIEPQSDNGG